MTTQHWTEDKISQQNGRVAIVTGANSGIGFETARALASKGATVILACRSEARGNQALAKILETQPEADVSLRLLDLSSLNSIQEFTRAFVADYDRLDLLINNAGVMMTPAHSRTADGFELQFGVNHLGHFALTTQLLELIQATPNARIVNVSSLAHKMGKIDFEDLNWENKRYNRTAAYGQSKLANLLFTFELQRRVREAGGDVTVAAAHPGWSATNLQRETALFRWLNPMLGMAPAKGALPTLYAATADDVEGGDYIGPGGFLEAWGYPKKVGANKAARDHQQARQLWNVSETLVAI